jgi:hypothetical protein
MQVKMKKCLFLSIIPALVFLGCASGLSHYPGNVRVAGKVSVGTESAERADAALFLLREAQRRGGNCIVNIKTGNDKTVSALALIIADNDYTRIFNATRRSGNRLYGLGSARMPGVSQAMVVAQTRARAQIARNFGVYAVNDDDSAIISRVSMEHTRIEQVAITPDGTLWVLISVDKNDIGKL